METTGIVLVVEDDDAVAGALRRAAERHAQTRRARGLSQALAVLREPGTELRAAIIDVGLVDGSGLDLARSLRRKHPSVPLLVITGQDTRALANEAQLAGAHFAYKPITSTDVDAFLFRALAEAPDARLASALSALAAQAGLSEREAELVERTLAGVSRAELAEAQGVKETTIKTQIRCVLTKTGEATLDAVARRVLAAAIVRS